METNVLTSVLEALQSRDSPPEGAVWATGSIQRGLEGASNHLASVNRALGGDTRLHHCHHPFLPDTSPL